MLYLQDPISASIRRELKLPLPINKDLVVM